MASPVPNCIQKGERRNPKGSSKLAREKALVKHMTSAEYIAIVNMLLELTPEQLELVQKDPKTTCLENIIASIIVNAGKHGDDGRLEALLNRSIGKVPDKVIMEKPKEEIDLSKLSDEELQKYRELTEKVEVKG